MSFTDNSTMMNRLRNWFGSGIIKENETVVYGLPGEEEYVEADGWQQATSDDDEEDESE